MYGLVPRSLLLIPRHYLAIPPDPYLLFMILSSLILASDCSIPDELAATIQGGVPSPGTSQFEFAWIQPLIPSSPWRVSKSKPPAPHQSHKSHKSFFLPFFRSCGCLWKRKLHGEQLPTPHYHHHQVRPHHQQASISDRISGSKYERCIRTATLRTHRRNRRGDLTALSLFEGRASGSDVEMTEDRDGDKNLTEEEMSMRPEPESKAYK